ncbi:hypothetical protein CLV71_102348 [Actinophytocola oryzae]|uniref:Uncharacterized protein n=1 Tax=Actinophytocola oryzae TaxID=502181 RepID=A0A4R7W1J9_9PSEU|nr:hypothetical protein CLV71_102348 [Actinophytocola oryzae]
MRSFPRAVAVAVACIAAVAMAQVPASAAPADEDTVVGGCSSFPPTPCGEVQNNSVRSVRVSLNWTCSADTAPIGSSLNTVTIHSTTCGVGS